MSKDTAFPSSTGDGAASAGEGARDQTLPLRDGRTLGFAEYGNPNGFPLMYFHGSPGSRLPLLAAWTDSDGPFRFIAPDRPGMGLSSFQRRRSLLDWPDDVRELADHLGLQSFGVMGLSGGGPYALACAVTLAPRVDRAITLSGLGPFANSEDLAGMHPGNRMIFTLARRSPMLLGALMTPAMAISRRWPELGADKRQAALPLTDQEALADPEVKRLLGIQTREAFRTGTRGALEDIKAVSRDWGFELDQITIPVHLWHGAQDTSVPMAMARRMAAQIPHSRLHEVPDQGHVLFVRHWPQIVTAALAQ